MGNGKAIKSRAPPEYVYYWHQHGIGILRKEVEHSGGMLEVTLGIFLTVACSVATLYEYKAFPRCRLYVRVSLWRCFAEIFKTCHESSGLKSKISLLTKRIYIAVKFGRGIEIWDFAGNFVRIMKV